jgi:hypothetical protein
VKEEKYMQTHLCQQESEAGVYGRDAEVPTVSAQELIRPEGDSWEQILFLQLLQNEFISKSHFIEQPKTPHRFNYMEQNLLVNARKTLPEAYRGK